MDEEVIYHNKYNKFQNVKCIFPALYITKKGALDSQPQVITFTKYLPMVGGSLRVLRLPPPLKLVAMI